MIQKTVFENTEPTEPGLKLVHFNDLQPGDEFIYMGGDPTEWNKVTKKSEDEITYNIGKSHIPATNDKLFKDLHVWVKNKEVTA